jgi:hypothetical protein
MDMIASYIVSDVAPLFEQKWPPRRHGRARPFESHIHRTMAAAATSCMKPRKRETSRRFARGEDAFEFGNGCRFANGIVHLTRTVSLRRLDGLKIGELAQTVGPGSCGFRLGVIAPGVPAPPAASRERRFASAQPGAGVPGCRVPASDEFTAPAAASPGGPGVALQPQQPCARA